MHYVQNMLESHQQHQRKGNQTMSITRTPNPVIEAWHEFDSSDYGGTYDGPEWLGLVFSDMEAHAAEVTNAWTPEQLAEARRYFALTEDQQGGYLAAQELAAAIEDAAETSERIASTFWPAITGLARFGLTVAARSALMNSQGYTPGEVEEMIDNAAIDCDVPMPFNKDNLHGYAAAAASAAETNPESYDYVAPAPDVLAFNGVEPSNSERNTLNALAADLQRLEAQNSGALGASETLIVSGEFIAALTQYAGVSFK